MFLSITVGFYVIVQNLLLDNCKVNCKIKNIYIFLNSCVTKTVAYLSNRNIRVTKQINIYSMCSLLTMQLTLIAMEKDKDNIIKGILLNIKGTGNEIQGK